MTAELRLTVSQKLEVGNIVSKLNRNGGFVTASLYGEILRISALKKEIDHIKSENLKIEVIGGTKEFSL